MTMENKEDKFFYYLCKVGSLITSFSLWYAFIQSINNPDTFPKWFVTLMGFGAISSVKRRD